MRKMTNAAATAVALCVLLFAAFSLQGVLAYDVRLTYMRASTGVIDFERPGYCHDNDPTSHTLMPATEGFNTRASEALRNNGAASVAPTGGFSRKAICVSELCDWQYYKGLYEMNERTYSTGVRYNATIRIQAAGGFYMNWDSASPAPWQNISYWGLRQMALKPDGTWKNVAVVTYFTDWVCEHYEYKKSDHVFFPTWINGDPIMPTTAAQATFSHCGHEIQTDSKGRLVDVQCEKKFPWWAGLIIAVVCLVLLITAIIIIWCCCCLCDRRAEEKEREQKLATTRDNPSSIPTQSEVGMSRRGSSRFTETETEADNERSFSRSGSEV